MRHEQQAELENERHTGSYELVQSMDMEKLLEKIQQLPPGYRVIFNLYAIEGYNHREIGEKLGIHEGTSKSQFSRAKRMLQEMILAEQEYERKNLHHVK